MSKVPSILLAFLLLGVLTSLGCRTPATENIPSNQPIQEKLNQFRAFNGKTGTQISTKADAIRVVYYSLSLKGAKGVMNANWVAALGTSLNKAIPSNFLVGTDAQKKISEMLYTMGYIDRAGVLVAPEIRPSDRDKVVAMFAKLLQEPVPSDLSGF